MKKIWTILLTLTLCVSALSVSAESVRVTVESKTATTGETVKIPVSLEDNTGLLAALFCVEYDKERLELIEVEDGRLLEGGTFSPDFKSYPYKMLWNSASYTNFTEDGVLATLTFKVSDTAAPGKATIQLSYKENDVFDVDLNNVPVTVTNGSIDVLGNTPGDSADSESIADSGSGSDSGYYDPYPYDPMPEPTPEPSPEEQMILTIGKKEALVFGEVIENDVAPIIRNDRTMLPARFVAENLGAEVTWDADTRTVTITKENVKILITIDSQTALVNDAAIVLDSPAFIENDRTYTPLRFIAEKLGATVTWNGDTQEVTISK